jgi:MFS family permease
MRKNLTSIIEPLLSLCFFVLGASFFGVLITLSLKNWGYSEQMIGFVQSAYYAGLTLGGIGVQGFINRTGHIRCFAAFASILCISMLLMGLLHYPFIWFVLRLIAGFSIAALYVVIESWLLAYADESNRGTILSFYMIALYVCQSLSQYILKVAMQVSIDPFTIAALLTSLSIIPLALGFTSPPEFEKATTTRFSRLFKVAPFGVIGCLIGGVIQGSIGASLPSFALSYGFSSANLMAITILGGGLLQWPIGKLSDRIDREKVLLGLGIAILIPCSLIYFAKSSEMFTQILCFFLGGFAFTLYSIGISHVCDHLKGNEITGASAILLFVYGMGSVLSPNIAPFFMHYAAWHLFIFYGMSALVLVLYGFYCLKRRSDHIDASSTFVVIQATTTALSDLDPRAPHEQSSTE